MDIHSGGIDLRFPHHDNEIAQAEAHYDSNQWVNYFLHTGHLHIKGSKMSKSLKNFITIKQAIAMYSVRQIRMLFLLHKYNDPMDYAVVAHTVVLLDVLCNAAARAGDNTMVGAISTEKAFNEFFHSVKTVLRGATARDSLVLGQLEVSLAHKLEDTKATVKYMHMTLRHDNVERILSAAALCDDFDTPTAIKALLDLIKCVHKYIHEKNDAGVKCQPICVRTTAEYVTKMFKIFGLVSNGNDIGFNVESTGDTVSREDTIAPIVDILSTFRVQVRAAARNNDSKSVMLACDSVRDKALPPLGIRLEDKGDAVVWKLEDPAVLAQEIAKKEAEILKKKLEKEENARKAAEKAAEKAAKDKIDPQEMFRTQTIEIDGTVMPKYSQYDDDGVPTHDANNAE
eukprot:14166-Heterococcus_DN1.PRE.1